MSRKDSNTPTIQVLERAFSLLDTLASQSDPISLKEISERTKLHPSTAHRILNDLAVAKGVVKTELSEIKGIGEKISEKLLKKFRSVQRIRESALEDLTEVIGAKKAESVFRHFH